MQSGYWVRCANASNAAPRTSASTQSRRRVTRTETVFGSGQAGGGVALGDTVLGFACVLIRESGEADRAHPRLGGDDAPVGNDREEVRESGDPIRNLAERAEVLLAAVRGDQDAPEDDGGGKDDLRTSPDVALIGLLVGNVKSEFFDGELVPLRLPVLGDRLRVRGGLIGESWWGRAWFERDEGLGEERVRFGAEVLSGPIAQS